MGSRIRNTKSVVALNDDARKTAKIVSSKSGADFSERGRNAEFQIPHIIGKLESIQQGTRLLGAVRFEKLYDSFLMVGKPGPKRLLG